jgi:nucleoid-associated protein YgaU
MFQHRWSGIIIRAMIITGFIFIFSGCAKQPSKTAVVEKPADVQKETVMEKKMEARQPAAEKPAVVEEKEMGEAPPLVEKQAVAEKKEKVKKKVELKNQHIVKEGESLWWIAKYKDQYNDPYLWPLIYETNKKLIKDPNLIYPGQKFIIPRTGYKMDTIKKERKKAGAPKPYLPPQDANLPAN